MNFKNAIYIGKTLCRRTAGINHLAGKWSKYFELAFGITGVINKFSQGQWTFVPDGDSMMILLRRGDFYLPRS